MAYYNKKQENYENSFFVNIANKFIHDSYDMISFDNDYNIVNISILTRLKRP